VSGLTKGNGIVGLVSDGAKALVKLALSGLGCPSLPDMFHLLYALSKSIGTAIARQQVQLQKNLHQAQRNSKRSHLCRHLWCQNHTVLQAQQDKLKSTVKTISKIYTPCPKLFTFDLNTRESQFGFSYPLSLQSILANVGSWVKPMLTRAAAWQMSGNDRYHTYQGQFMPGGSGYSKLSVPKPKTRIHNIGCSILLPWVYCINKPKRHGTPNSNRATTSHSTSARSFSGT